MVITIKVGKSYGTGLLRGDIHVNAVNQSLVNQASTSSRTLLKLTTKF